MNSNISRYVRKYDEKNNEAITISTRTSVINKQYFVHIVKQGDTLVSLANQYLNNDSLYWYIADFNPQISFADSLTVGSQVRIPLS
jgi:hypothetical protein